MKKFLAILLCGVIILSVVACDNKQTEVEKPQKTEMPYMQFDSIVYYTFDHIVTNFATDVVKGKCVNREMVDGTITLEIEVYERYAGEDVDGNIYVNIDQYNSSALKYEEGKDYYFVLDRRKNVYFEHDIYIIAGGSIYIPAENIRESTVHNGPIPEHSELPADFNEKILIEYIQKLLNTRKDRELFRGDEYTKATDLETIIKEAEYVVEVEPIIEEDILSEFSDLYYCVVIDVLKGTVEKENIIEVLFPEGKAKIGEKYLLALNYGKAELYKFSSQNSMLDKKQYDEILEYIKE